MQQQILIKLAETLSSGTFLDEFPSWISEVQMREDGIVFRVDDDHKDSVWYKIGIEPA